MKKTIVLLATVFICATAVKAQVKDENWQDISILFADGLYKSAIEKIEVKYSNALKNGDDVEFLKAIIYRSACQAYLSENVTTATVNSLRADLQNAKTDVARALINSLLGEVFWNYYAQNRWRFHNRTDVNDDAANTDVETWSLDRIFAECIAAYKRSLEPREILCKTKTDYINSILVANAETRQYRPTLYDFVAYRAIEMFGNSEIRVTKPKETFIPNDERFFDFRAEEFVNLQIASSDSVSTLLFVLQTLQQLTKLHLQERDFLAIDDATLKRLEFMNSCSTLENKKELFKKNLEAFTKNGRKNDIWFEAMYRLVRLYKDNSEEVKAVNTCRLALMEETIINERQKNVFQQYIKYIKHSSLKLTVEKVAIPEQPLKILVDYKDLETVYFRIYRVPSEYRIAMAKNIDRLGQDKEKFIERYALIEAEWKQKLPKTNDYKEHSTEVIHAARLLSNGTYIIVASDSPDFFNANEKNIEYAQFQVSQMAYIFRNELSIDEYYIVNRMTGKPMQNAKFLILNNDLKLQNEYKSDNFGIIRDKFNINYDNIISINNGRDALILRLHRYSSSWNPFDFKNRDETKFFTDRAIYRPGQTVYFKGIALNYNDNKYTIMPNRKETITLRDVNRQEVSKIEVISNEYGTFSGSFVLPQSALGGTFEISGNYYGGCYFNVEEYKRPTFEVKINAVEKNYKFDETVTVSGIAQSYAGYNIDNANVSYNITRNLEFPYYWFSMNNERKTIANGEIKTDENGKFEIKFIADGSGLKNDMQIATYNISVDVTDNNGETHSAQYSLKISKKPLIIAANIPAVANLADNLLFDLATKNLNNNFTEANITVKIYRLKQPQKPLRKRLWKTPDKPLLTYEEYKKLFPNDVYADEDKIENFEKIALIKTLSFNTDKTKKINLEELKKHGVAAYRLEIAAKNKENIETNTTVYLQLQDENTLTDMKNWVQKRQQTDKYVEFYVGGISDSFNVRYNVMYRNATIESKNIVVGTKPQQVRINIPETKNNEEFAVNFASVYENRFYTSEHVLKPREDKNNLDISLVTFRDKLQPNEKEQWKLQVKSPNNEKAMAEMVATLYDASLDVFRHHNWSKDFATNQQLSYFRSWWSTENNFDIIYSNYFYKTFANNTYSLNKNYDKLIRANNIRQQGQVLLKYLSAINAVEGSISGIVVDAGTYEPLDYVAVLVKNKPSIGTYTNEKGEFAVKAEIGEVLAFSSIGYDTKEVAITGNNLGVIELEQNSAMLHESVINTLASSKADRSLGYSAVRVTPGVVVSDENNKKVFEQKVTGADGYFVYAGTTAKYEVVVHSPDYLNGKSLNDYTVRSNFNETVFFYPELRTNEKGEIIIDFTIPESLTRWKLLGLAHTKNLETGLVTAYTVTQKEIAITANAPRFFRDGDEIEFSAKINNITDKNASGTTQLLLFDALTMQPLDIIENEAEQTFSVNANQSVAVNWKLKIPSNINAITYRLLASTGKHSDGEEKTIPVLPNSMLVTESLPFTVRAKQSKNFEFEKLLNNNSSTLKNYSYTLEFTSNPVWYAVQALPYIMEYPFECSEQIFSRFYANSLSSKIIDKFPQIKRTFDIWKMTNSQELLSNLEKNQELKNILLEETPWLRSAKNETENKKRIALLFDLNKMNSELQSALNKLKNNQLGSGAFPWFSGMCESRYITQYIAVGLEHLKKLNAVSDTHKNDIERMKSAAIGYLDREIVKDYNKDREIAMKYNFSLILHYLYLRSFSGIADLKGEQKTAFDYFFNRIDEEWQEKSIYQQALIALTLNRLGKPQIAEKIINSIKERAQTSEEMGMYWAENVRGYYWYQSPIETQSLLIEAFSEIGNNAKEIGEMKIWLLRNKQTTNWKTTTATAKACYALLMPDENNLSDSELLQVKLNNKPLAELKKDELQKAEAGTGYVKTSWHDSEIERGFGKINVTNPNNTIAWGSAYWQYFENLDKITSAETDLKIKREYFIEENTSDGKKLTRIAEKSKLKVGDKVKVRIELRADRDYEYVHLKDMRASGLEPVNVISQSKYQDGIWYYENTRDASTNFFIYMLPKGTYVFEYDLRANNAGEFSTGIATFQCMYAPEFSAHSAGEKMIINEMKN